jgi:TP901 family phage tail tape measure protein
MKAFGIQAKDSMSIVDKFNETGNSFAISSKGVGNALMRSASALAAAGNTLDESIALVTAANAVIQDPDSVGEQLCPAA